MGVWLHFHSLPVSVLGWGEMTGTHKDPEQGVRNFQFFLKTDAGYGHRRTHGRGEGVFQKVGGCL